MANSTDKLEAWGAQLHVRPLPGKDGGLRGAAGAYAWVFVLANGQAEYRELVAAEMESLGLFVAEIEHLSPYVVTNDWEETAAGCVEQLSAEWPVQYHDFHTYRQED